MLTNTDEPEAIEKNTQICLDLAVKFATSEPVRQYWQQQNRVDVDKAVESIIYSLDNRNGFEFNNVDEDILTEIKQEMSSIINSHLQQRQGDGWISTNDGYPVLPPGHKLKPYYVNVSIDKQDDVILLAEWSTIENAFVYFGTKITKSVTHYMEPVFPQPPKQKEGEGEK
jgi:hypothetical protein